MNIRKNIDYTEMYTALDFAMEAAGKQQMELYCEIGKAVSQRTEKGAAVAAAEYLAKKYPDVQGFSPPFPLVKDIVGYLKMCHSILPIKR